MDELQKPRIFLSYARADRPFVAKIAQALTAAGLSVWWDTAIETGSRFSADIERELNAADVVVVVWSAASVNSAWVLDEAGAGRDRGRLVPVQIDATLPPLGFRQYQATDLAAWKGRASDPKFTALVGAIKKMAGSEVQAPLATPPAPATTGPSRRALIGGAAGVAALAAGGFGAWKFLGQKADDGTASVVVLPFANLSGDPAQAFFSDGIAEELRNALSQIRGLKVIGRVSSETFRDTDDLSAAAEKLGVDHVLTGSVRRSPSTIRIGAQLVDGKTGVESWSQSYDQPVGDSLAIQSQIATSVVAALSARLSKAAGEIMVGGTSNPQAQELFLRAKNVFDTKQSAAMYGQIAALLDAAIALDPDYAQAWAFKAHNISNQSSARSVEEQPAEAMAATLRAVTLAPGSGFVRLALARQYGDRLEMRRALAEAERGVTLAPAEALVLRDFARTLQLFDPDRSVIMARNAVALDPLNVVFMATLSQCLLYARRFSEVAAPLRMAESIGAGQAANILRVRALLGSGQPEAARAALDGLNPDVQKLALAAILEARAGKRAASDAALKKLQASVQVLTNAMLAGVHAQRGETALALNAIERAMLKRETALQTIAVRPEYDPIRREPRFKAVQDKIIPPDLWVPPKRRI